MADGPSIRMYEPAEVGLSQAALDRLLPYADSIVGEGRVPNGSEASTLQAAPSCAAPPVCLRPRRVSAPADARARSDAGVAPRQDRLLRGHGPAERRQRGVADRRARRAAPRHHLPHLQHEQADHLSRAHDALRGGQVPALRPALAAPGRRLEEGQHGGETHSPRWTNPVRGLHAGMVPDGCAAAGRSTSPATRRRATSAALSRRSPARRR